MSKSVSDNTTHEMINQICEELQKLYFENKTLKAQITEYEILEKKFKSENEDLTEQLSDSLKTCLKQNTKIKELKEQLKVKSNPITHSDSDSDSDSNTAAKSIQLGSKQNKKIKESKVKSNLVTHIDSDSDSDSDSNTAAKSTPKFTFDEKKLQKLYDEFTKKKD